MRSKYYDIVPENWKCEICNKGRDEETFCFRFNKQKEAYVYKLCNRCRNDKKVYKPRKAADLALRAKLSQDFKEYFKKETV